MVSTGSSWMKGLFPNIDLSFSYLEKIKEGFSHEVLGRLRTEEHHEKSVLWRWSGQHLQGSTLNYLFIYLIICLFFLCVCLCTCVYTRVRRCACLSVLFSKPRITLASSPIDHCLLGGTRFLTGSKACCFWQNACKPQETAVFTLQGTAGFSLYVGSGDRNSGPGAWTVIP